MKVHLYGLGLMNYLLMMWTLMGKRVDLNFKKLKVKDKIYNKIKFKSYN